MVLELDMKLSTHIRLIVPYMRHKIKQTRSSAVSNHCTKLWQVQEHLQHFYWSCPHCFCDYKSSPLRAVQFPSYRGSLPSIPTDYSCICDSGNYYSCLSLHGHLGCQSTGPTNQCLACQQSSAFFQRGSPQGLSTYIIQDDALIFDLFH